MTNFEMITKDEVELAGWLSDARIGCDMCPVETECSKDCGPIYDRCYRLILEWLERDEEAEERDDDGNVLYWHKCTKFERKKVTNE